MMPRSEHSHLAEVALGGLFEPWRRIQSIIDIDRFEFQFLPGVREALLGAQLREDITAVQEIVRRQVAEFIERSSVAARTFQAMKTTSKSNKELRIKEGAIPFAETHLEHQSDSSVISLNTQDGDGLAVSDRDEQVVSQKRRVLVRQYRLDHLLSTDSRGEKWKAYDINTRRHVSVSIHSSYGRSSDNIAARWQSLVQRYQQACEAQPQHLEKVYDIGSDDEIVYIVAKLEDGIPMSDLSRNRGILGMEFAKALAFQLDSALSALHESGLAHGNISPENVLIDSTGIAKLRNWSPAAWGAAVRPDDSSSLRYDWQSSQYSPPEAGQSQPDRNSDLFSLGCVIFAALAGQPPYAADFGSLADLPPNVSRVLRRVVLGLIALDPSTRESGARSLVKLKASMSERMGRRTTEPSRQQPESREVQEQQDETNTAPEYIASIPTPYEDGDLQLLRPYAMTGGRTRSRYHLSIESLVTTTPRQDQFVGLLPEHARICYLCLETKSVAEISAILSIPLGVARILVADLSEAGYVSVNDPNAAAKGKDEEIRLLNEVRDRLEDI
jgi:serine/threonine protein kinase